MRSTEEIIRDLRGVEGYLSLSHYRKSPLTWEEYAEGRDTAVEAQERLAELQAQVDRLREAVAHKPISGVEGRFRWEEQRRMKADAALNKVRQAVAAYDNDDENITLGDHLDFYMEVSRAVREP